MLDNTCICSLKLTAFLEVLYALRKLFCFSELIMSVHRYPNIFLCQMETIVYLMIKSKTF